MDRASETPTLPMPRLWPDGPIDETRAWSCLATNLLVLPGLGSLLAGRRSGFAQAALALAGFALTCVWLLSFMSIWIEGQAFPLDGGSGLGWGLVGVLLFGLSWTWSLVSGLAALRQARQGRG
jgi:hypothetical protein